MDGWMDRGTDGQQNSSNDGNNDASCRPLQSARCCASPSPIHPGTEGDGRERAGQRVQLVVRKPLGLTRERPQCDDERRLPAQRASRYVSSRLLAFSPVLVRAFRSPGRGRQEGRKKRGDGKGRKKERKKERKEDETPQTQAPFSRTIESPPQRRREGAKYTMPDWGGGWADGGIHRGLMYVCT